MDWFESFMRKYSDQCPMVFNHNDFRSTNIMVLKDSEEILFCDFEYCSYGFRGYDFVTFLMEWDKDIFQLDDINLPSDDVIEKFIQLYIEGCDQIDPGYSARAENSCQKIMNDVKIQWLYFLFAFMAISLHQNE
ncbi:Choline/ethanolamine kinase-like protein, partial [Euroglyphus maynei]